MGYLHAPALADDRIGAGHPEGLFEAWANLYYRFAIAMDATDRGDAERLRAACAIPTYTPASRACAGSTNCVRSADLGGVWIDYA